MPVDNFIKSLPYRLHIHFLFNLMELKIRRRGRTEMNFYFPSFYESTHHMIRLICHVHVEKIIY